MVKSDLRTGRVGEDATIIEGEECAKMHLVDFAIEGGEVEVEFEGSDQRSRGDGAAIEIAVAGGMAWHRLSNNWSLPKSPWPKREKRW